MLITWSQISCCSQIPSLRLDKKPNMNVTMNSNGVIGPLLGSHTLSVKLFYPPESCWWHEVKIRINRNDLKTLLLVWSYWWLESARLVWWWRFKKKVIQWYEIFESFWFYWGLRPFFFLSVQKFDTAWLFVRIIQEKNYF